MNEHEHNHEEPAKDSEIVSWGRKLIWSWVLTIPIAIIMLSERLFGYEFIEMPYSIIAILVLGFPVIFIFPSSISNPACFPAFPIILMSLVFLNPI